MIVLTPEEHPGPPLPRSPKRSTRLRHKRDFERAYGGRRCRRVGCLVVYVVPNSRDQLRLGLSVGRKVGNAVVRNLVKRRLREAFRTLHQDHPGGSDVVINVQPHDILPLEEYAALLGTALSALGVGNSDDHGASP